MLAFVAKELRDGEPLDGLFVIAFVRGDHARKRGRHFRPQCHGAVALVGKIVKLADDFLATFGGEEFQRFQRRPVVFAEAVAAGGGPPFVENELAGVGAPHVGMRERFGIKIAESRQSFHAARVGKIFN